MAEDLTKVEKRVAKLEKDVEEIEQLAIENREKILDLNKFLSKLRDLISEHLGIKEE